MYLYMHALYVCISVCVCVCVCACVCVWVCVYSPPALFIFKNITLPVMICVYECIYIYIRFTYVYQLVCVFVCA